jgi:hypothetical protein
MAIQFRNRNLDAAVVSAAGGIIILYVGLIGLKLVLFGGDTAASDLSEVIAGTLWGILIIIFSALLFLDNKRSKIYGSAIMVLSIASWYGTSGGLFIGFVITLLGGIMGFVWKPGPSSSSRPVQSRS